MIETKKWLSTLAVVACLAAAPPSASAEPGEDPEAPDTITVKGQTLRGKIVRMGSETIEFKTIYGDGNLRILLEDVEDVQTAESFRIYHGDRDDTTAGPLRGVRDGDIVMGDDPDATETVALDDIRFGVSQPAYEGSLWNRLRSDFRHWNIELETSFNFEQSRIDQNKIRVSGQLERRRDPLRLRTNVAYAFDEQSEPGGPHRTTKDEFTGTLLGQHDLRGQLLGYDLGTRLFAYGLMGGEFDRPRRVEYRLFPTVGFGYRWLDGERSKFSTALGFGWVVEQFKDAGQREVSNNYAAAHIALEGSYEWEIGPSVRYQVGYWPGLQNAASDWLFRSELAFTVPVWNPLSLRATFINVNDNNPTPNTGNNKFETNIGIVLGF